MSIEFSCTCGKQYKLRDELGGKKAKCARCGKVLTVPMPAPPEPEPQPEPDKDGAVDIYAVADPVVEEPQPQWMVQRNTEAEQQPAGVAVAEAPSSVSGRSGRDWLYLVLAVALVPLLFSTFHAHQSLRDRLRATARAHPEIRADSSRGMTMHRLLQILPEHKLEGAWLAEDSEPRRQEGTAAAYA